MTGLLRRARASGGALALLAALALVAALLVDGVPRLVNGHTDGGLRADLARVPHTSRDVIFRSVPVRFPLDPTDDPIRDGDRRLEPYRRGLPAPLPAAVGEQWYTARVGPTGVQVRGDAAPYLGNCTPSLSVRTVTGADRATRLVEGRLPASAGTVEVTVARPAAAAARLRVGSALTLVGSYGPVPVRVVGVVDQLDPAAPIWDDMPLTRTACPNPADGDTVRAGLLTDAAGIRLAGDRTGDLVHEWRYRIAASSVTAARLPELAAAVVEARRRPPPRTLLAGGVETSLTRRQEEQEAVAAVLAVVQSGAAATLLGLIVLAAGLLVERRRAEFALIRARGGSVVTVGGRLLAETLLVVPAAVLAGRSVGALLPGRAPASGWVPLAVVAAVATLSAPVLAAAAQRRPVVTGRRDLTRARPAPRRLVAEAFVVLLAGLGVLLVRRRGLAAADGTDPYLVVVPVLLAVAAALVVLRVLPWPLRAADRLAARGRGAVAFLGLAGAGRGSPVRVAPLAVLVVAVATGVFTGTVAGAVGDARDRATDREVAGDAVVLGSGFAPGTAARLAAVPGVTAVAPMWDDDGALLRGPAASAPERVRVLVVDGPAAARVLRLSGNSLPLPAALTRAGRPGDAAPALVSPDLAARFAGGGTVQVQGTPYRFRVAAVGAEVAGAGAGAQRLLVLPAQALPVPPGRPLGVNRIAVAGGGADPQALRRAGDAGQREYLAGGPDGGPDAEVVPPTTVTTWRAQRSALEDDGANRVLGLTFAAGAAGAGVLALLAVGFAVVAGAPARSGTLARLRTLGLSAAQGRRLVLYELVPVVVVALAAGGLVGAALPRLVGPALGLSEFTAGVPVHARADPALLAAVLAVAVPALAAALLVENVAHRRGRRAGGLRPGGELQ